MSKLLLQVSTLVFSFILVGCSHYRSEDNSQIGHKTANGGIVGSTIQGDNGGAETRLPSGTDALASGSIGSRFDHSMDENDKQKMSHAMDKAPGTPTEWKNERSGVSYSVVPVRKVTLNGNPYCRKYVVSAMKNGNKKEINGTGCITSDGSWHEVSN